MKRASSSSFVPSPKSRAVATKELYVVCSWLKNKTAQERFELILPESEWEKLVVARTLLPYVRNLKFAKNKTKLSDVSYPKIAKTTLWDWFTKMNFWTDLKNLDLTFCLETIEDESLNALKHLKLLEGLKLGGLRTRQKEYRKTYLGVTFAGVQGLLLSDAPEAWKRQLRLTLIVDEAVEDATYLTVENVATLKESVSHLEVVAVLDQRTTRHIVWEEGDLGSEKLGSHKYMYMLERFDKPTDSGLVRFGDPRYSEYVSIRRYYPDSLPPELKELTESRDYWLDWMNSVFVGTAKNRLTKCEPSEKSRIDGKDYETIAASPEPRGISIFVRTDDSNDKRVTIEPGDVEPFYFECGVFHIFLLQKMGTKGVPLAVKLRFESDSLSSTAFYCY